MNIQNGFIPTFCMEGAGGETGGAGGGGGTGDAGTGDTGTGDTGDTGRATDDGAGGKASFMSETPADKGDAGDAGETGQVDMTKLLGEDYSKNPNIEKFLKTDNPVQEMAKSLIEAQAQVGKKMGIPNADTPAEEAAAFYKELGVPDDGAGYGFEKPEGIPDGSYSQEHADKWAGLFKDNNITGEAANNLRDALFEERVAEGEAANVVLNEALDKGFGDQKSEMIAEVGAMLKEAIPDDSLRQQIEAGLNDENTPAVALMAGHIMKHMKTKFGQSDNSIGDGGEGAGKSLADLRADAKAKSQSPAYLDPMHKDHSAVKKEVKSMYDEVGRQMDEAAKQKK